MLLLVHGAEGATRGVVEGLEPVDLEVTTSASAALELIDRNQVELVLLEWGPTGEGRALLQELRKVRPTEALPIIVLTAQQDAATLEEAYRLGATDMVSTSVPSGVLRGKVQALSSMRRRITELERLVQADRLLGSNGNPYQVVADYSNDWEVLRDSSDHIVYCSPSVERLLGYTVEEYTAGVPLSEFVHPDDYQRVRTEYQKLVVGAVPNSVSFRVSRKSGEQIWVETFGQPIHQADGTFIGFRTSSRDITELKLAELRLREANATKDKFISVLAHDLRGPLGGVMALSGQLKEELATSSREQVQELVTLVNETSTSTYQLLEELLEWARLQRGGVDFRPQPTVLSAVLADCVALLANQCLAKHLQVTTSVEEDLAVHADGPMLRTILRNLLTNAVKFTPASGTIRVGAVRAGPLVTLSVADTGLGMDARTLQSLFKIGETRSRAGTNGERGAGFGLLLCKEFVERHGGALTVESEVGKGSVFRFTLPPAQPGPSSGG